MRRAASIGLILLLAASGAVLAQGETANQALARATREAEAAEARMATLDRAATRAQGEAARLRAEQAAALAAIDASEAHIAAADAALVQARGELALREERLAKKRAPVAALLAGIVTMGRRPPLLALTDGSSVEELVRVRALLDSTMPVIRQRSAVLMAELGEGRRLADAAASARDSLTQSRAQLAQRQQRFAALELRAAGEAERLETSAFLQGDRVIAGDEAVGLLGRRAGAEAAAAAAARHIAELPFAPPRPVAPAARTGPPPLAYSLPLIAPVTEGLGAVSPIGVSSRGLTLAAQRGAALIVPADGIVAFAGPFRDSDGLVIIDHGHGWTSLVTNLRPEVNRGDRVTRGSPLGRALGDVGLELREQGQLRSPALIARSSVTLSK